jgi:hypothetical protein
MENSNNLEQQNNSTVENNNIDNSASSTDDNLGVIKPKNSKAKKIFIIILGILGSIALLIPIIFFTIVIYFSSIFVGECDERNNSLSNRVSSLKSEMSNLNLSDYNIVRFDVNPNGDCLTGSGADGLIEIAIDTQPLDKIDARLSNEVFGANAASGSLAIGDVGDNTKIDELQKNYKYGNQMYTVSYILQTEIECIDETGEYVDCDYQRDPIEIYGLRNADIVRIYIRSYL